MIRILSILILCSLSLSINAIKAPIKFGKPDKADLEMTVYEHDTSAVAVVLFDYARFDSQQLQTIRTMRIKILKKEGLDRANQVFYGSSGLNIRGRTFNLVNGEIQTDKLKPKSIFEEEITDGYYRTKVSMPNIKVGSVYDLEIIIPVIPDSWYFQRTIPVRWSEIRLEQSQYVEFRKNFTGYLSFSESGNNRWVAKNVPAFKVEPYTDSKQNYIFKFDFDILSVQFPGYYKSYTTTWDAVAKRLNESSYFGEPIRRGMFLNSLVKEIQESTSNPEEQLKQAYYELKKVKWDEYYAKYTTQTSLKTAYDDKLGNSADLNLMLVTLLNKLDITAYPLVMSSRSNGVLPMFPTDEKLDYVICYAKIGEKEYFLDNTEEYLPLDLLPMRCLNNKGLLVIEEKSKILKIPRTGVEKINAVYNLSLEESGLLKGNASFMRSGYAAFDFREDYHSFSSQDDYLEDMENSYPGLRVETMELSNLEDDIQNSVKESYTLSIRNAVSEVGDHIYITPLLHHAMEENPFKVEKREYPVDYGYVRSKTYIVNITLPDGYVVEELPKPIRLALPDQDASILYNLAVQGNKISIIYKFKINKIMFLSSDYEMLKGFYHEILKKHAEPIIIKKG